MSTYIKLLTFPKVRELVNSKITNMLVQDVDSEGGYVWEIMKILHFPLNFAMNLNFL